MENEIMFEYTLNVEENSFEDTQSNIKSKRIQQAAHSAITRIINTSIYFIPEPDCLPEDPIEQEPEILPTTSEKASPKNTKSPLKSVFETITEIASSIIPHSAFSKSPSIKRRKSLQSSSTKPNNSYFGLFNNAIKTPKIESIHHYDVDPNLIIPETPARPDSPGKIQVEAKNKTPAIEKPSIKRNLFQEDDDDNPIICLDAEYSDTLKSNTQESLITPSITPLSSKKVVLDTCESANSIDSTLITQPFDDFINFHHRNESSSQSSSQVSSSASQKTEAKIKKKRMSKKSRLAKIEDESSSCSVSSNATVSSSASNVSYSAFINEFLVDEEKESLSQMEQEHFIRQQAIEFNRFSSSQGASNSQVKPKAKQKEVSKKEKLIELDDDIQILNTPVKSTNKSLKKQEDDDDDVIIISPEKRTPSVKRKQPLKDFKGQPKPTTNTQSNESRIHESSMNATIIEPVGKKRKTKVNETIELDCTLTNESSPVKKTEKIVKAKTNKKSKQPALLKVESDDDMPDLEF